MSEQMDGSVCMVTGATSGIGAATAYGLAQKGATVIVVGRDRKRCSDEVRKIIRGTSNNSVEYLVADLSSQKDIHRLAEEFKGHHPKLDVLVNNAVARFLSRLLTVDGYEMTLALNHLGYFMLTRLLIDSLKKGDSARIINVSSSAHADCRGMDFDDLQSSREYIGKKAYAQSKLANLLFTYELARRLKGTGMTVNALHPGFVLTHFSRNNGLVSWSKHIIYYLLKRQLIGPTEAAKTSLYLASAPDLDGITGKYFSKEQELRSSDTSYDKDAASCLWQVSSELTGLTP